jgi:predicted RNA-binding Zn-ribbon protein involved in translation (DUF1610 family)
MSNFETAWYIAKGAEKTHYVCDKCGKTDTSGIHGDRCNQCRRERAFGKVTKSSGMPGQSSFVTLMMPESAYDIIMETLYMDLRSNSIDDSIKARLQQALSQIQQK